jgi:hypothetical protein
MNFRNGKLWLEPAEIEDIALEALDGAKWPRLPDTKAIDIDRVISRHLKIEPSFVNLPDGILGQTKFSRDGKKITIEISATLADEANAEVTGSVHRYRTTAAHEAGHALIHACLYVDDDLDLFLGRPATAPTTLCRSQDIGRYNRDDWREWQANQAMGCLLLPKPDVLAELKILTVGTSRDAIIRHLSTTFLVSQEVAKYRLERLSPSASPMQLTLG